VRGVVLRVVVCGIVCVVCLCLRHVSLFTAGVNPLSVHSRGSSPWLPSANDFTHLTPSSVHSRRSICVVCTISSSPTGLRMFTLPFLFTGGVRLGLELVWTRTRVFLLRAFACPHTHFCSQPCSHPLLLFTAGGPRCAFPRRMTSRIYTTSSVHSRRSICVLCTISSSPTGIRMFTLPFLFTVGVGLGLELVWIRTRVFLLRAFACPHTHFCSQPCSHPLLLFTAGGPRRAFPRRMTSRIFTPSPVHSRRSISVLCTITIPPTGWRVFTPAYPPSVHSRSSISVVYTISIRLTRG